MSDIPYARVKELVLAARQRPRVEQEAFLAEACAGDETLRHEVEALLEHDTGQPSFLDSPHDAPVTRDEAASDGELDRVGPYRLLRLLGEGGMGRVFLAEQTSPIRREVAIKLIRRGLDTDRVVSRFESERQSLAMMDHPGIARVYEAGADARGRPYFVMERVNGEPITAYCGRHRLTTRARLELFLHVCAAVQHAHQRGLIHRDLKPSNVLVAEQDGRPMPKIIDFGIAKAIEAAPGAETLTMQGQVVGTPDYMSPEQAGAVTGGVDTRTDVYSLGVILYELLTGSRPYHFDDVTPAGMSRRFAEAEPVRPSGAVAREPHAHAGAHPVSPTQLRRELAGDLDVIVLTALRREPDRRYPSVEALAAEIERHLAGLPISARPDTWTYRSAKFVRRHRAPVTATGVGLLVMLGLGVTYTVRLRVERDRADAARAAAEAVTDFLAGMLESPDPGVKGRDVTVRSVLEQAEPRIERELGAQPRVAARLDEAVGRAYHGLGDLPRAERHLRRSLAVRERLLGRDAPATLNVRAALWDALDSRDRVAEAESLARVNLALVRARGAREDRYSLQALNSLARFAAVRGEEPRAESLYRYVVAVRGQVAPEDSVALDHSRALLANLLANQARFREAESLYVPLLAARLRRYGPDHPLVSSVTSALGLLYLQTSRFSAAESMLTRAVDARTRTQGGDHPQTVGDQYNLAVCYAETGRHARAEPLLHETLARQRRLYGERSVITLITQNYLGRLYANTGRHARAESLLRVTLAGRRAVLGDESVGTLGTQVWLAIVLGREGKSAEAESLFARTLVVQRRVLGPRHTNTLNTEFSAGDFQLTAGRPKRAAPLLESAADGVASAFGEDHPDWVRYATRWGECLTRLGRFEAADSVLNRAWKGWQGVPPSKVASPAATARALGALYQAWGRPADALAWEHRAEVASRDAGPTPAAR